MITWGIDNPKGSEVAKIEDDVEARYKESLSAKLIEGNDRDHQRSKQERESGTESNIGDVANGSHVNLDDTIKHDMPPVLPKQ